MQDFYKFPLNCEIARLQQEVSQLSEVDWLQGPVEMSGLPSIVLISVAGTLNHDFAIAGTMTPTPFLARCPYFQQILASFKHPLSRSRLVRLRGNTQTPVTAHHRYHWLRHRPIYIPITVHPTLQFFCNDSRVTMNAGEAWIVDHSQPHWLVNESEQESVYWVVEIRKTELLPNLDSGNDQNQIPVEPYCFEVLTPEEIEMLTAQILLEVKNYEIAPNQLSILDQAIQNFKQQWQHVFYRFGHQSRGELAYQTLILDFKEQIASKVSAWLAPEGKGKKAIDVIDSMLLTSDRPVLKHRNRKSLFLARTKHQLKSKLTDELQKNFQCPEFEKPLFIVSAPRAGSTLLFETLSQFAELWTIAEESHEMIEGIPEFHPSAKNFSSNRLTATDTTPVLSSLLRERFAQQLQNSAGQAYVNIPIEQRPTPIRFLEKTPKNALRIPLLQSVFPQALFIYLYRNPYENISSLVEGWRSRRFIAYHRLPEWPHREWSFLLPPGWHSLQECSLIEIATYQWKVANTCILEDLQQVPTTDWCAIHYTDLIQEPKKVIKAISEFAGLCWSHSMERLISTSLPVSQLTLSAPALDKWRKHEQEMVALLPTLEPVIQLAELKFIKS